MTIERKSKVTVHIAGAFAIAIVWVPISFILSLALAGAEDTADMTGVVSPSLKLACGIVFFPMRFIGWWEQPPAGLSDRAFVSLGFFQMFLNGLFWGFLSVLLVKLSTRFLRGSYRR